MLGEGDGLATDKELLWLAIRTADCVPILIAHPEFRVVAAVHAGWRGAAQGILAAAVERLASHWNCAPSALLAAAGPAIGPCCFEVGEEVAGQFPSHRVERHPKPHLDLPAAVGAQLRASGLAPAGIEILNACTVCDPARFHSFRRDGGSERMVSAIRIRSRP